MPVVWQAVLLCHSVVGGDVVTNCATALCVAERSGGMRILTSTTDIVPSSPAHALDRDFALRAAAVPQIFFASEHSNRPNIARLPMYSPSASNFLRTTKSIPHVCGSKYGRCSYARAADHLDALPQLVLS